MITFRFRQYGSTVWTTVTVSADDDEGLENEIGQSLRERYGLADDLHAQELTESGWEDCE